MKEKIKSIIEKQIAAINQMPIDGISQIAIEMIHKAVHVNGGKLVVSGMGKAGQIGLNIATTFSSTGTPAIFLHPSEAQHGDLGLIQENDLLFVISNSGKTRELIELTQLAKGLQPKLKIICLSGKTDSELSKRADLTLSTGNPKEVCPLGLTPTTSTDIACDQFYGECVRLAGVLNLVHLYHPNPKLYRSIGTKTNEIKMTR